MYSNLGVQRYRETDIGSMSSEKMIVLLYERIVTDLQGAAKALDDGNRIGMTKHVNHSQRIISELRGALDHSIGGEVAENLDALYTFLFHEHLKILLDQDPVHLENCLRVLEPLLEAWRQIPHGTGDKAALELARGPVKGPDGPEPASGNDDEKGQASANGDPGQTSLPRKTSLLSVSA